MREELGVYLALPALFSAPTVELLADVVNSQPARDADRRLTAIALQPDRRVFPASSSQERLWFMHQVADNRSLYNVPMVIDIAGPLDIAALQAALAALVARHEPLRTTFGLDEGRLVQRVAEHVTLTLREHDLSDIDGERQAAERQRLVNKEARQIIDLVNGPMLRALLITLADDRHQLMLTQHHIVTDEWSLGVMFRDLSRLYRRALGEDASLPELSIQYGDYSTWQRQWLESPAALGELLYWKRKLAGELEELVLPADRPGPRRRSAQGDTTRLLLPADWVARLDTCAAESRCTRYVVLLTAFLAMLHRESGQTDLLLGTPVANRGRRELEELLGSFVNSVVLRVDAAGQPTFAGLLERVRESLLGAFEHQALPFDRVIEAVRPQRSQNQSPLVRAMFVHQTDSSRHLDVSGAKKWAEDAVFNGTAKFDLTLFVGETTRGFETMVEYRTELFSPAGAKRVLELYRTTLDELLADRNRPVRQLQEPGQPQKQAKSALQHKPRTSLIGGSAAAASGDVLRAGRPQQSNEPRDDTERELASIWREVLGVPRVGIHDDFFALGGHSLLVAKLCARIERRLGVALPLATIFQAATIASLADIVRGDSPLSVPHVVIPLQGSGTKPPLFLLPGIGGHALTFRELASMLGGNRPIYGLQAIGVDGSEEPPDRIDVIASRYIDEIKAIQPRGPYYLSGHSIGGLVAYEMAVQLHRQGDELGLLALMDCPAPGYPQPLPLRERLNIHARNFLDLPWRQRAGYVRDRIAHRLREVRKKLGDYGSSLSDQPIQTSTAAQITKVDQALTRAMHRYRPTPFAGELVVLRADKPPEWPATRFDDPLMGWGALVSGPLREHAVPGSHLEIFSQQNVATLAGVLRAELERATRSQAAA